VEQPVGGRLVSGRQLVLVVGPHGSRNLGADDRLHVRRRLVEQTAAPATTATVDEPATATSGAAARIAEASGSDTPSAKEPPSIAAMSLVLVAAEASTARAREGAPIKEPTEGTREAGFHGRERTGGGAGAETMVAGSRCDGRRNTTAQQVRGG